MADDEVKLHYEIEGDGPPVVFTPGWLNTADVWSAAVRELGGSVRGVRWDLRGHGESEVAPPGQYGRRYALGDLDRIVELAGTPAVLVGHSLGGYLSLAYAIEHPARVSGLVLVAAGPGFRNPESRKQWNDAVLATAETVEIPPGSEEITMHVDSMVIDHLSEIDVPVVVIVGERDKRFLPSADVFANYLDVRERIIVPGAGHMVHAKHPGVVADAVRSLALAPGR